MGNLLVKHMNRSLLLRYCGLLLLCLISAVPRAQSQSKQTDKPIFYGISAYYGTFQVHTNVLSQFRGSHPSGIGLEMSQLLLTDKAKNTFGLYPKWGLGLGYVDFGHPDLGHALTALAYAEPFFKVHGAWRFSAKVGMGVAYMSNPYHVNSNPLNRTYSTKLAFPLSAGLNAYYFFNNQWAVKTSVSFEHISNGGLKAPNLGINYPLMAIALEHTLDTYNSNPVKDLEPFEKQSRQELLAAYSIKKDSVPDNQSIAALSYNRSFGGGRINSFTLAAMLEYRQLQAYKKAADQWSVAPLVGNEFLLGRLRFGQQIGFYLLQAAELPNNLFQNYYLRYQLSKQFTGGINLKAHGRVADYLAIQVGFAL